MRRKGLLTNFFKSLALNRTNLVYLFSISFFFKLISVLIFHKLSWYDDFTLYTPIGDDEQYVGYSENLYLYGEYYYQFSKGGVKNFIFRMPGMTFLYFPLRLLFSKMVTLNLVVLIQVFLSSISIILFSKQISIMFKSKFFFWGLFLSMNLGIIFTYFDASLMCESLSLSTLLIGLSLTLRYKDKMSYRYILLSGLFFTWMVFLRPYMIVFFILVIGYFILNKKFKLTLFLLVPFLLIDGIWTIRNFNVSGEIVFLQTSSNWYEGNETLVAKINFLKAFGLKAVNFEENSHCAWFNNQNEAPSIKIPDNSIFPESVFVGDLTLDSLLKARKLMHLKIDPTFSLSEINYAEKESSRILNKFIKTIKEEDPFQYQVSNRIRLIKSFIMYPPPRNFRNTYYPYNILLSTYFSLYHYITVFIGAFGLILLFLKKERLMNSIFFLSVPPMLLFLVPIYLRIDENRFIFLAYPFLILGVVIFASKIREKYFDLIKQKE